MRGSLRAILGLVVLMGVAGGLDNATDAQLIPLLIMAIIAMGFLYSGVRALGEQ